MQSRKPRKGRRKRPAEVCLCDRHGVIDFCTPPNAVLEMNPGNEHLTLPGPGGYSINWSPGSIRYKLEQAPSGHLILPCDEFMKVGKTKGGLKEPLMTFFGQEPVKKVTCEVGTQTECTEEPPRKQVATAKRNRDS